MITCTYTYVYLCICICIYYIYIVYNYLYCMYTCKVMLYACMHVRKQTLEINILQGEWHLFQVIYLKMDENAKFHQSIFSALLFCNPPVIQKFVMLNLLISLNHLITSPPPLLYPPMLQKIFRSNFVFHHTAVSTGLFERLLVVWEKFWPGIPFQ